MDHLRELALRHLWHVYLRLDAVEAATVPRAHGHNVKCHIFSIGRMMLRMDNVRPAPHEAVQQLHAQEQTEAESLTAEPQRRMQTAEVRQMDCLWTCIWKERKGCGAVLICHRCEGVKRGGAGGEGGCRLHCSLGSVDGVSGVLPVWAVDAPHKLEAPSDLVREIRLAGHERVT